jgi:hypothetical protein
LRFLTRQPTQHFTQLIVLILQMANTLCKFQILHNMQLTGRIRSRNMHFQISLKRNNARLKLNNFFM